MFTPRTGVRLAVALAALSAPLVASAEETDGEGRKIVYKQVSEVEFGELAIGAPLERPTGVAIYVARKQVFNPLIVLRTEFKAEIQSSVSEVK